MKSAAFLVPVSNNNDTSQKLFSSFRNGKSVNLKTNTINENELIKPKRKRRNKSTSNSENKNDAKYVAEVVAANSPIIESYDEVTDMIRNSISQINQIQNELKIEFDQIRNSRIKGKYNYITDLSSVISNLASTKLQAIKEIENIITTSNKMEISRIKDLKIDSSDDNQAIMGLYENIVNTPRRQLNAGFMPAIESNGIPGTPQFISLNDNKTYDISPQTSPNSNFTPEENRMVLESNPDIKTVVVYDARTDDRYFKVMNTKTGEYVENVSVPDPFLLEGITFNFRTLTARNANINMNFPLVVIGQETDMSDPDGIGAGKILDDFGGNY